MNRLTELEEKRRQLEQLRERRASGRGESLVDQLLQGIEPGGRSDNGPMISTAIQTDPYEGPPYTHSALSVDEPQVMGKRVITYDKMVQTTAIQTEEVDTGHDNSEEESNSTCDSAVVSRIDLLPSLVVEDQHNTVNVKSFSLQEVLSDSFPQKETWTDGKRKSGILPIHSWNAGLEVRPGTEIRPVSLDRAGNLVAIVFQSLPIDRYNVLMTPWSYLFVLKWDANQVIDRIEFRGQIITMAKFLRKETHSDVVSLLVTSHTGKTILTELRCVGDPESSKKLERNMISKNFFCSPIPALEEYRKAPQGHERFLAASSTGVLNELSSLDLSIYEDATSSKPPLSSVKLVSPRPSELVTLEDNEDEDDTDKQETAENLFRHHLLKVSLFDALAISAISLSPSDSRSVYIGTEDGGIYRLNLDKVQNGILKVPPTNNGFLPINSTDSDDSLPMFHSSHVTALSHNEDELLMSASLDWTCSLWDPSHSSKLGTIDMGSPVIDAAWLNNEVRLCAVLTWDAVSIIEWNYHSVTDRNSLTDHWESTAPPRILSALSSKEVSCDRFTCFKTFKQDNNHHVLAIGANDQEIRFHRMPTTS